MLFKRFLICLCVVMGLSSAAFAAEPLDINKATATELAAGLNGVGAQKAAAIVAYRKANGGFANVDELVNVEGIGDVTLEKLRGQLTVGLLSEPKATE